MLTAVHHGEYPLRGVNARMVDVATFKKSFSPGNPNAGTTFFDIGDLTRGSAKVLGTYPLGGEDRYAFNIFFNGLNGFWTEQLRLRRINGKWAFAIKVTGPTAKSSFEDINPGYPKTAGKVDWGE